MEIRKKRLKYWESPTAHYDTDSLSFKTKIKTLPNGYSLVELLLALSISGGLLALSVPAFTYVIHKQKSDLAASEIWQLLGVAKSEAAFRQTHITVCPTQDLFSCSKQGKHILITDHSQVLKTVAIADWTEYSGFPQHQFPTFEPSGICKTNGRFQLRAHEVILAYGGRARLASKSTNALLKAQTKK